MAKVTIADLRERISIRNFITQRNERGDILNVTEFERCEIWANIIPLTAKNLDTQPERANKITYRVTVRYCKGIQPDDEILWQGRRLKLISPPYDLDGRKKFTAFDCEEVISNGETL